jgi:hypothetical protein
VSTLHEQLLAEAGRIAQFAEDRYITESVVQGRRPDLDKPGGIVGGLRGLRAVVEKHAPIEHRAFGTLCGECSVLESGQGWDDVLRFVAEPCNTKRAIAESLGVPTGETPK